MVKLVSKLPAGIVSVVVESVARAVLAIANVMVWSIESRRSSLMVKLPFAPGLTATGCGTIIKFGGVCVTATTLSAASGKPTPLARNSAVPVWVGVMVVVACSWPAAITTGAGAGRIAGAELVKLTVKPPVPAGLLLSTSTVRGLLTSARVPNTALVDNESLNCGSASTTTLLLSAVKPGALRVSCTVSSDHDVVLVDWIGKVMPVWPCGKVRLAGSANFPVGELDGVIIKSAPIASGTETVAWTVWPATTLGADGASVSTEASTGKVTGPSVNISPFASCVRKLIAALPTVSVGKLTC